MNKIETPFTHSTAFQNPGPGKYDHSKKKNDIRTKIIEESSNIPFGTGAERACNKKQLKSQIPGPGTYIDINNP